MSGSGPAAVRSKEFVGRECGPLSSVVWASLVVTSLSCQYSLRVYSWPCFSFLLAFAGFVVVVVVVLFVCLVLVLLFLLLLLVSFCGFFSFSSSFLYLFFSFFFFVFVFLKSLGHEPVSYACCCCCYCC